MDGWMDTWMSMQTHRPTSGRVYCAHDSNKWLLLGKRLGREKGVEGLPFWGEYIPLHVRLCYSECCGSREDCSTMVGSDSWLCCPLPAPVTAGGWLAGLLIAFAVHFLNALFFLPCLCMAKHNPPQLWYLSQLDTLLVSFSCITIKQTTPHISQ